MIKYIVASSKDWFKESQKSIEYKSLNLIEISTKEDLNLERLEKINPRYIFFLTGTGKLIVKYLNVMNVLYFIQLRFLSEEEEVQFKI